LTASLSSLPILMVHYVQNLGRFADNILQCFVLHVMVSMSSYGVGIVFIRHKVFFDTQIGRKKYNDLVD